MLYMHFKCINAQLFQIKILFVVAYKLILDNDFVATKKEKKKKRALLSSLVSNSVDGVTKTNCKDTLEYNNAGCVSSDN